MRTLTKGGVECRYRVLPDKCLGFCRPAIEAAAAAIFGKYLKPATDKKVVGLIGEICQCNPRCGQEAIPVSGNADLLVLGQTPCLI